MSDGDDPRRSRRVLGDLPEFGLMDMIFRRKSNNAPPPAASESENEEEENVITPVVADGPVPPVPDEVLPGPSKALSRKSNGSRKSVASKASSVNSVRRLKIQAELETMEEEERLEAEAEAKKREADERKLLRQKALAKKKLELKMSKIDEEADQKAGDDADDSSQIIEDEKVAPEKGEKEALNFTPEERNEISKWLQTVEPYPVVQDTAVQPVMEMPTKAQMLARKTIGRDLPPFSGDLDEWGSFISQYRQTNMMCGFTPAENLYRLQRSLKGKARETVSALLVTPNNVDKIIVMLERRFGRPEDIIEKMTKRTTEFQEVKVEKPSSIVEYGIFVQNLVVTIENLKRSEYLMNPQLLKELVQKLPPTFKMSWAVHREASKLQSVTLRHFADWLEQMSIAAQTIDECGVGTQEKKFFEKKDKRNFQKKENVLTTEEKKPAQKKKCHYCGNEHFLRSCSEFLNLGVEKRWQWAKKTRRCFCCLSENHAVPGCDRKKECGKNKCTRFHHPFLHYEKSEKETENQEKSESVCNAVHSVLLNTNQVLLRVVPVTLRGPAGEVKTFALLDDGSTTTLIEEDVANKLGLEGPNEEMQLKGMHPTSVNFPESRRVALKIRNTDEQDEFEMKNVRTVRSIDLPRQTVDVKKLQRRWPYLKSLKMSSLQNAVPKILIGEDNIHLTIARELKEGKVGEPILSRTKLGWVIHGNTVPFKPATRKEFSFHMRQVTADEELHQLVKQHFSTESFGVAVPKEKLKSEDEKRADSIMQDTSKRSGDRWETGLLWKSDGVNLPDSRGMALNRLKTTERKMDRDPKFAEWYREKIEEYLSKGYARKLTPEELVATSGTRKLWYLPHFGAKNPHKPDKVRLVFDAAAKVQGISLNDMLLTGPDLYNSLIGVLLRFRQGKIGFSGDIREMFHQIKIVNEDLPAQRFLWRGLDRQMEPEEYEMNVMIFGAACSPASAQYVKNRNALEYNEEYPGAVDAIIRKHYMDDYLDSVDSEAEAIQLIDDVTKVHRYGGFDITKWVSSSPTVLEKIPGADKAEEISLTVDSQMKVEKILGMYWNPSTDCFTFKMNFPRVDSEIVSGSRIPTKREMLALIMSLFDPLGMISNLTINLKILLQEVWKTGIDWDDQLPSDLFEKWEKWIKLLPSVTNVQVPRCYSVSGGMSGSRQLHVFVDSSLKAFCAVAYLRVEYVGEVSTAFVMARTRVAPLKPMTVPRLELQAAVMGTRLATTIKEEMDLTVSRVFYWYDSRNVLCWIRSNVRRFKQFVAFRIGEILEVSDVSEWNWIPTLENVADEGTKDTLACHLESNTRWLTGPEFLRGAPENWPKEKQTAEIAVEDDEMEIRKEYLCVTQEVDLSFLPDVKEFAEFPLLVEETARRLKSGKGKSILQENLKLEELLVAEQLLLKRAQEENYALELQLLRAGKLVPKSSKIYALSPKLDDNGILRLDGRIRRADVAESVKRPIILHPKNLLTQLIVKHHHEKAGHSGMEFVVNEIRQQFWIPKLRAAVKSAWKNCQMCKIARAKPMPPLMGELPHCRLESLERPFTQTGMDYFGPITVTIGRRTEKRYGVLFTCLTTRAVHLEIASSLTTDSAIQAIRRMIARRGYPRRIHSDNGTNLRGADTEMRKALTELDQQELTKELAYRRIEWSFLPPASSHMAGSWERLIRSVKVALRAVLQEQSPREEVLHTLMVEAENIVNSRPLTHVSVDPEDLESLTPNHFLIGTSSAMQQPGIFSNDDLCLRKQWRIAQRYADLFWKRWLREYLPTLARRTKWFERREPVRIGDVVIIADDNMPRNCWPKGIIAATFPGRDGQVRVVDVRTDNGIFRRPVAKICILDIAEKCDDEPLSAIGGKKCSGQNVA